MNIFALYHFDYGFIGLYSSPESSKSFTREFVDVVICDGKEGRCDEIATNAINWMLSNPLVNCLQRYGWDRVKELDGGDRDTTWYGFKKCENC